MWVYRAENTEDDSLIPQEIEFTSSGTEMNLGGQLKRLEGSDPVRENPIAGQHPVR